MEILGIGSHIIEVPRIGRMIEQHDEIFLRRVYTEREIHYCQARKLALLHFAGRWAAKEAIFHAIGVTPSRGIHRTDLEIRHNPVGPLKIMLRGGARDAALGRGIADFRLSISHCRTYAVAFVLALGRPGEPAQGAGSNEPTI
jgi:holo-[acyl-carrier protein] synthase